MKALEQALTEYAKAVASYNEAKAKLSAHLAPHKAAIKEVQASAIGQAEKDTKGIKATEYSIIVDAATDLFVNGPYVAGHRFSESGIGYVDVTPQPTIAVINEGELQHLLSSEVGRAYVKSATLNPAAAIFISGGGALPGVRLEEQTPKIRVSVKEYTNKQQEDALYHDHRTYTGEKQ